MMCRSGSTCRIIAIAGVSISLLYSTWAFVMAIVQQHDELSPSTSAPEFDPVSASFPQTSSANSTVTTGEDATIRIREDSGDIDERRNIDFGCVMQGEPIRHVFAIRNSSSRPLVLAAIRKSCSCQTLNLLEGTTVPAGSVLQFDYETPSLLPGRQSAKLVILTDSADVNLHEISLTMTAVVTPIVTTTPPVVQFSVYSASRWQELRVTPLISRDLPLYRGVSTSRSTVTATLEEQTRNSLRIRIQVPFGRPSDRIDDVVILHFEDRHRRQLRVLVPVRGNS